MWDPENEARAEGWDDGYQEALKVAIKVALSHKCRSRCADRGMGSTCEWEIAEDLKGLLKSANKGPTE